MEAASSALEQALTEPLVDSEPFVESDLGMTRVGILAAQGQRSESRAALCNLCDRILAMATAFTDDEIRAAFLNLEPNVRALALAKEWLGQYPVVASI